MIKASNRASATEATDALATEPEVHGPDDLYGLTLYAVHKDGCPVSHRWLDDDRVAEYAEWMRQEYGDGWTCTPEKGSGKVRVWRHDLPGGYEVIATAGRRLAATILRVSHRSGDLVETTDPVDVERATHDPGHSYTWIKDYGYWAKTYAYHGSEAR